MDWSDIVWLSLAFLLVVFAGAAVSIAFLAVLATVLVLTLLMLPAMVRGFVRGFTHRSDNE